MSIREKLRALVVRERQAAKAAQAAEESKTESKVRAFLPIASFLREVSDEVSRCRTIKVEIGETRGTLQIRNEKIEIYCMTQGYRIRTVQFLDLPDGADEIGEVHKFQTTKEVENWVLAQIAVELAHWQD